MRYSIVLILLFGFVINNAHSSDKQPNVVLVITDDQGFGDVSSHGNNLIDTPVHDRIANEGVRFERFYVSPVCAPTRASLLTGRYHLRTGVHGVTRGYEIMRNDEVTIAELLKFNGYSTGAFGKWHNGSQYPHHPNGQGFDEFLGFCAGHWNNYFDTILDKNGKFVSSKGYMVDVLTDAALNFIEQNKSKPFLCYLSYNTPHTPWQVPDKYFRKYMEKGIDDPKVACAYAMVENIDWNMGRVLSKLEQLNISNETIFIFLTDNGPNGIRYNANMKGRKGSAHEGGVRVPLFIRYPSKIKPNSVVKPITAHIDLLPTIMELCGISEYITKPLDGRSLVPLISGKEAPWPSRMLFTAWGGTTFRERYPSIPIVALNQSKKAVRTDRWRAVDERKGWELYDMQTDPNQKVNLAATEFRRLSEFKSAFENWFMEVTKDGFNSVPIHVGHIGKDEVTLEGHYAYLHPVENIRPDPNRDGISYHGPAGWANDWIDNWTSTSAYPYWNLNIIREGEYDVLLKYSCEKSDIGCKFQLEVCNSSIAIDVDKSFEGVMWPSADRIHRKEVFERQWGAIRVGTVKLEKGFTKLKLRATEIPGDEAIELKAVQLIRKR